jgi:hypothetical protein
MLGRDKYYAEHSRDALLRLDIHFLFIPCYYSTVIVGKKD